VNKTKELILFLSYSHEDNTKHNPFINNFNTHLAPLKKIRPIKVWYDRNILPGESFQNEINQNLDDADIICLFISANFFNSKSCMAEKEKAMELKKKKGIPVIPIILSPCGWQDDKDISELLVLPTDGKPITAFQDYNAAWNDVYQDLKKIITKEYDIKQLQITEEFQNFLANTEMLSKAHSQKEKVILNDIFVHQDFSKYNELKEYETTISAKSLIDNILDYPMIAITGDEQSGKTTLCKKIFTELRRKNFVPIYIPNDRIHHTGKLKNRLLQSSKKQYIKININEINKDRLVPILDDLHLLKNKEEYINELSAYSHCIVIVDDIFSLNITEEKLLRSFIYFRIKELKPSLRYELIKKWVSLTDKKSDQTYSQNSLYKDIDNTVELIETILGKTIGRGIMPAHPFFILSAIVTYETFALPLEQEITSQGYCYQALIYFYLRKKGVKNDEIEIYINVLTEIAYFFYKENKYELSPADLDSFMNIYLKKYNLPITKETLMHNLTEIITVDSFNNYAFKYQYLFYFFVAKYLAEHFDEKNVRKEVENIVKNLHVNEYAYIAIFIAHHSKNVKILEEIEVNALCLFDKYLPATLSREDVEFFDEQVKFIIETTLQDVNSTPEKARLETLNIQDEIELSETAEEQEDINDDEFIGTELRRAIKTVEVIGHIVKNRAGSLEKVKLEEMFEEAMAVHLRILTSFFELIKNENEQKATIDYISKSTKKIINEKKRKVKKEEIEKVSKVIFWNLNFLVVYGIIEKVVHSLGSDKLIAIINKICDRINTPASFLIKHGVLMWYTKNLKIDEITDGINAKEFSNIAKSVMKLMVVNHCSLHQIKYKDRQRIENKLGISGKKLLLDRYKNK
jgi:hypothetical protein